MAETTFTFFDASETERTGLAGANGSSQLAPATVLYDVNGAVLVGRQDAADSLPVVLSNEDLAKLEAIRALLDGTLAVSAAALPLPSGAATSSAQSTGNSSLSSIDGKLPALRTLQSASIAASTSGNTQVVAAVAGQRIYVAGFYASVNGAVNVKFQSATTDITGLFYGQTAGNGLVAPHVPPPAYWCRTASGEALNINLSAAVAVGGVLLYWTE